MTDQTLRRVIGVLATLLVVVLAAGVLLVLSRGGSGRGSPSPGSSVAAASASARTSPSASRALTPTATPVSTEAATPSSGASPSASPLPAPLATLTLLDLKLDPTGTPGAQPRIVSFRSDGAGTISAKLASHTAHGTTHMCLKVGTKVIGCNDIASGTFTGKTTQAHTNWQVTLQGTGIATPVVDLTVTFQSLAPSVKIEHARFDGTAFPDTNGIKARFTARGSGSVHLVAGWGGHPFLYEIDLFDETSGTGNATLPNQGPSTNTDKTLPVVPGGWRLVLQNIEGGLGTTDLTAVISWP